MSSTKISVKGMDDKLHIKIPEMEWHEIKSELNQYIQDNGGFLQGAKIVLELGDNLLKSTEMFDLKNILLDNQISIAQVMTEVPETRQAAELMGLKTFMEPKRIVTQEKEVDTSIGGETSIFVVKTLRSGNVVNSEGHLTVIGDVNPGASIRAKGNIVVWGKLKGEAHAGVDGDPTCIVLALEMTPSLITIANIRYSELRKKSGKSPEQAFISKNEIKISPWKI
jgi:septum site-determining protein MinC